ncbi:MAG: hypothetical protein ACE5HU_07000, partial [Acidobacteriota bacterium]
MPRSSRLLALSGIVLLAATASFAQSRRVPRDYDALGSGPRPRKAPATMAPASGRARGKAMRTLKEQRLGLPTFLWAGERGRMVAAQGRRMTPAEAARMHLNEFAPDYRLTPADVNALRVRSIHDAGRGPIIVSFSQQVNGIDVFRDEMKMVMDRDRDLIAIAGYLTHPEPKATVFNLSAAAAIARALEDLTGESFTRQDLRRSLGPPSEYEGYRLTSTAQARAAVLASDLLRAKKVFCHLADGFEPAYMIDLSISWPGDVESLSFGYVISAMQGQGVMRKNFTVSEAFIPRLPA